MLRRPLLPTMMAGAAILMAGCGGGAGHAPGQTGGTGAGAPAPPPVSRADPVNLLPMPDQVRPLISPSSTPSRHDERLNPSTLSSAFSAHVLRSQMLASGTAELDIIGRRGTFLYARVYEFKTLAGAQSLTPAFLSSTRLSILQRRSFGGPGQQATASSQPYGRDQVSYRYAFRDHNILSYIELDGPRRRYSLADVVRVATVEDQRIRSTLH